MNANSPEDAAEPVFQDPARDRLSETVELCDQDFAVVGDSDFVDPPDSGDRRGRVRQRVRLPGPGFWESVGWMGGLLILHIGIGLVVVAISAVMFFSKGGFGQAVPLPDTPAEAEVSVDPLTDNSPADGEEAKPAEPAVADANPPVNSPSDPAAQFVAQMSAEMKRAMPALLGLTGIVTCLYGWVLCRYRLGKENFQALGWRLPSAHQLVAVGLLVIPLSALCTSIQTAGFKLFPGSMSEMQNLFDGIRDLPFPLLVLILALLPALGEELLFRGLIGRGLLARFGLPVGMVITSILFGLMHINPAQVLGVIPLGLAMHFVYVTTRSFWGPVLLHFLNNSLAAVMLQFGDKLPLKNLDDPDLGLPLGVLTMATAAVCGLTGWLWQTRVEFRGANGDLYPVDGADCGVPIDAEDYTRDTSLPYWWQVAASLSGIAGLIYVASNAPPVMRH